MISLFVALGLRNDHPAVVVLGWLADAAVQVALLWVLVSA